MFKRFKYDIAISVAEEDAAIAEVIAQSLKAKKISCYFYREQSVQNWGQHILRISLSKYGAEARYVLVIISEHFMKKYWTGIENQIMQVFRPGKDIYILPLRVDDTPVDGISKYIAFVKWESNEEEIADKIRKKLRLRRQAERKKVFKLAGIFAMLVLSAYLLLPLTATPTDYSSYLAYMHSGDSLVQANKFQEAGAAYKRALAYNPKDAVAGRKLALLDSASQFIRRQNHAEARKLFQLIVNIPASAGLSATALNKANVTSNPPLVITLHWDGNSLKISIAGGVPFSNGQQPYLLEGVDCKNCITWTKSGTGFIASVDASHVPKDGIRFKDRLGQFSDQAVPENAYIPASQPGGNQPGVAARIDAASQKSVSNEQAYMGYMQKGDSLFAAEQYADAKQEYMLAAGAKSGDGAAAKKIAACDERMAAAEESLAKNIPKAMVAAGSFTMGANDGNPDDGPEHAVSLHAFRLSKTEVTVAQYRLFCKYTGRPMPGQPSGQWGENHPVVNVTWDDAVAYCQWVNGRLPREAEWEYAARAGGNALYSGGGNADNVAWHSGNAGGRAHAAGTKSPNAFGLFDMTGNVWEWCSDWYGRKYYSQSDAANPAGPASGAEKVIRGGAYNSFINSAEDGNQLRITYRNSEKPSARRSYIGFRVAWDH